jgi:hypothetical protein
VSLAVKVRRRLSAISAPVLAALALAPPAGGQLVPLTLCQSAIPCNIPFGLRPADSVAGSPYARTGNAVLSVSAGVEEGLKPRIDRTSASEDPSEFAARLFLRRNPPPARPPSPIPAPSPR